MAFGLFKKKNNIEPAPVAKSFKKTSKKKDTYTLKLDNVMMDINMFSLCKEAPLGVTKLNGKPHGDIDSGFVTCVLFENPFAVETGRDFKQNKEIFGEKIASTIIKYHAWNAKQGDKPVITLYPAMLGYEGETVEDALSKLNHATRRDCLYQIKLRENLYRQYEDSQSR